MNNPTKMDDLWRLQKLIKGIQWGKINKELDFFPKNL